MEEMIGDLDELKTAVWHLAHADAEEIRQKTEKKGEQVREKAHRQAKQKREEILHSARAKAKQIRLRRRARWSREEREQFLRAREELLTEVWQTAEEKLRAMTEEDAGYAEALERMACSAVRVLGAGTYLLAADAKGHELLTSKRLDKWSRSAAETLGAEVELQRADDALDTWGGLVVSDAENGRRVDMTFAARLRLAAEEIRADVFRELVRS